MSIRNANGLFIGPTNSRPVLRIREKYILFLVIFFMLISLIGIFYLPELKTSKVYLQYLKPADTLGQNFFMAANQEAMTAVLPPPRSRFEDEIRLKQKIEQHLNFSQEAVIPKPNYINQNFNLESSTIRSLINSIKLNNFSQIVLPSGLDPDSDIQMKREKVKQMMITSWNNYKKYAWGHNELKPISKIGHSPGIFGHSKLGATIVDGMDTLFIMGLMDHFKDGRDWIEKNLKFSNLNTEFSVFETVIRYVGGLLSCYAFTKDEIFLKKAIEISNKLLPAFDTPTGLPYALIKPISGLSKNYYWASKGYSILSEVGTMSLEFGYLSALTGNQTYFNKIERIRDLLDSLNKPDGLYSNYIHPKTGRFGQKHVSIGALGDSFYEYLLKYWIMLDKKDTTSLRMYNEAIDAIDKHLVQKSNSGLVYIADMISQRLEHKMGHLACFSAGMFALGANENAHDPKRNDYYFQLGADIAETCHESYIRTATKIGPEVFWFTGTLEAQFLKKRDSYYILRPEAIEGWFYLWRLTKDRKYRDWAWEAVQAIEKYCLVPDGTGYSGIKEVGNVNTTQDDVQQSFFLAETLKYLYLIFSTDDLISLKQWVFNTEGHPLPIKNHNPAYPL